MRESLYFSYFICSNKFSLCCFHCSFKITHNFSEHGEDLDMRRPFSLFSLYYQPTQFICAACPRGNLNSSLWSDTTHALMQSNLIFSSIFNTFSCTSERRTSPCYLLVYISCDT